MGKITKAISVAMAICLLAGLLAGCSNGQSGASQPGSGQSALPQSTQPQAGEPQSALLQEQQPNPAPADTGAPAALSIMLPADKALFGEQLAALAKADGNTLLVRSSTEGDSYTRTVERALQSDDPPDIVWLEGQSALIRLGMQNGEGLYNLSGNDAGPVLGSLAAMVPEATQLPGYGVLTALPLGFYAEGYIVNTEVLGALLGVRADNNTLLGDLYDCNWQQWRMLVRTMESYLAKPGHLELRLGTKKYSTPNYRPGAAKDLRGVFAVSTADAAGLIGNAMDLLMGLCYESAMEIQTVGDAEQMALMRPVLSSLMGLLELESMHMTQKTGPLRRGENYSEQESFTAEQAVELFAQGTALFLRSDSRTALKLEQDYPELAGKLAMIPVKLPPPTYIEEVEQESESASQSGSQSQSASSADSGSGSASSSASGSASIPSIPEEAAADVIANSNLGLWYASDGYLCINQNAPQNAVASLLLRLYTTAEGQGLLQNGLHLYSFSQPYPAGVVNRQVADEVADGSWKLVADPSTLGDARAVIGAYLQRELLELYIWDEASQLQFLNTGYAALGLANIAAQYRQEQLLQDAQSSSVISSSNSQ